MIINIYEDIDKQQQKLYLDLLEDHFTGKITTRELMEAVGLDYEEEVERINHILAHALCAK